LFLPQKVAVIAQGSTASNASYDTSPWLATGSSAGGAKYGVGSPIHWILEQLMPSSGQGVGSVEVTVYPLKDHVSGVASAGTVTPSGTATAAGSFQIRYGGVTTPAIAYAAGAANATTITTAMTAAINQVPKMPGVPSGTVALTLTSKHKGLTANDLIIEIIGNLNGLVMTVVQPTGGLNNPDISTALTAIGSRWETIIVNQMGAADATTLGLLQSFGDARWDALEHKPGVAIAGTREAVLATLTAITDARKTDKTNVIVPVPGSPDPGWVIAGAAAAAIAREANNNPASDYNRLALPGIIPGAQSAQWNYSQRNTAVSLGLSTTEIVDNEVVLSDTITCYHPTGEIPPAYSRVVNITKLENVAYSFDTEFNSRKWQGCILIGDDDVSSNPRARRPKDIKGTVKSINKGLGSMAVLRDVETTNPNITVTIDSSNPNRVNIKNPINLSGNMNITDVENLFSFAFGGQV
jgi:phage tail sheath gpL-like